MVDPDQIAPGWRGLLVLPSQLVDALRAHRAEQQHERATADVDEGYHGLVFAQRDRLPTDRHSQRTR